MKHLFSLALSLMLLLAASIVPALAGTFTGIEFPKIIYGDVTMANSGPPHVGDYDLIDQTGFNMILSDYNPGQSTMPDVLNLTYNSHEIPVMFRLCKFDNISQYLYSTVIRRNIVEDFYYNMESPASRKYPGWSPRIRAGGDPLTDAVNMFPYPTVACPDYIKGTSVRDYDLDPVHDVIMYNGGTSEDIIFTTMDTEQNHGGEHDFLFNQYLFAGYFDASKHPRNTYFRLRLKVDGASLPPEEAALTLTLDHTWHNGDYSICTTSPVTSQSKTITFGDIENITPTLDGYRWVTFKDVNTPYMVYFCQNETGNQQQAYDSQVDPQLTLTNKYEGACAIYVDSLEVWEEDAYKLIYLNQQSCIDDIEDDLEDLSQQTGISLLIGFDQDDVHPEWYATNAKIVFLINDYASLPSLWSSAQFHWGNKLRAANYPENNDIQYRWYGPDNEFWNIDLSDYMNAVSQQCTGFPDFQSAYTYPFGATASDIQNELDKLIGWYSDNIDTGRGLRYVDTVSVK